MGLDKRAIETIAVDAVRNSIATAPILEQYIADNDKEPSWDGHIYIYENDSKMKCALKGRMPVQVKGKVCPDFSKDEISYSMEVSDLKNYYIDGGTILFVVYLDETGRLTQIYYSALTSLKLEIILKNAKNQKTKTIKLKKFPNNDDEKEAIFLNCLENRLNQINCDNLEDFQMRLRKSVWSDNTLSKITLKQECDFYQVRLPYSQKVYQDQIESYLWGSQCSWNLAFSDCIVKRDAVNIMTDYAKHHDTTVLLSAGGEGKSTILMQMCANLCRQGYSVLYHKKRYSFNLTYTLTEKTVIVIDNPPNNQNFADFIQNIKATCVPVVIAARKNEWNILLKRQQMNHRDFFEYTLPSLSRSEAERFANCIYSNLNQERTETELIDVFYADGKEHFLYSSMLMALYEKNSLDEIARTIVLELKDKYDKALCLLSVIVLSEHCNIDVDRKCYYKTCKDLANISKDDAKNSLSLEVSNQSGNYHTRHDEISLLFYRFIFGEDSLLDENELERIYQFLLNYHIGRYENSMYSKNSCINVSNCLIGLSDFGDVFQTYCFNRIIDVIKRLNAAELAMIIIPVLKNIDPSKEMICTFYKISYDREVILSNYIIDWCNIVDIGEYNISYSARWIFRKTCLNYNADSIIWIAWANREKKQGNVGSYEDKNSARWIFHEACLNHNADSQVWLAWANCEKEQGNVGSYEDKNSARWIFHEACLNHNVDSQVWLAWANCEKEQGNIGSYKNKNSARWIFREAYLNNNASSSVMFAWAKCEKEQGNIGFYEIENSARWIFREAYLKHYIDSTVWLAWANCEKECNNVGSYEKENSARWIFHEACLNRNADFHMWRAWAECEKECNNVGSYKEENSARWIFSKACLEYDVDSSVWRAWANFEKEQGNIGSCESKNSARWIFHEACLNRNADFHMWRAWAKCEEEQGNIGSYENRNSARWIFYEACLNRNASSNVWLAWARLEDKLEQEYGYIYSPYWICTTALEYGHNDLKIERYLATMELKKDIYKF